MHAHLLLSTILSLALTLTYTLNTTRPLSATNCELSPSLHIAQCNTLLASLDKEPWTHVPTTFGRIENPPGYIPKYRASYQCQFMLATKVPDDWRTETFTFADWMPEILAVERDCLSMAKGNMATVDVGLEGRFYIRLSGRTMIGKGTVKDEATRVGAAGGGVGNLVNGRVGGGGRLG